MTEFEYIKGYENLYKINKQGEVWSCWYKKIMTPQLNEQGYLYIAMSKEGKRCKGFIARLLAKQYIENPTDLPEIDHIDRNKLNNSLDNLRWVSHQQNVDNKSRRGCVYEDKRQNGKTYWKSSIAVGRGLERKVLQKTFMTKELAEEWLKSINV